jgi:hypothetical protein
MVILKTVLLWGFGVMVLPVIFHLRQKHLNKARSKGEVLPARGGVQNCSVFQNIVLPKRSRCDAMFLRGGYLCSKVVKIRIWQKL